MGHICGKVAAQNSLWRRRCNYGLRNLNELLMTAPSYPSSVSFRVFPLGFLRLEFGAPKKPPRPL